VWGLLRHGLGRRARGISLGRKSARKDPEKTGKLQQPRTTGKSTSRTLGEERKAKLLKTREDTQGGKRGQRITKGTNDGVG